MTSKLLSAMTIVLLAGVASAQPASSGNKPRVTISVSVDWEGRDLEERNLVAFEKLRAALPNVPLTHFLSGAYFTKPGVDKDEVAKRMRRALRPGDELGHHVHVWRSLVEAAGVKFHEGETFWGGNRPLGVASHGDVGHELELPTFTGPELEKIVHEGVKRLREAGFPISGSFRAGGWVADAKVLEAIRREGFLVDSSAVDAAWHTRLAGYRLPGRIKELWPGVTATSQPFVIETPAGTVLEMPDTGALADYVTADQMKEHLRAAIARSRAEGREVFVHIGFHQESAADYSWRVVEALRAIEGEADVKFETLENAATRARDILKLDDKNKPREKSREERLKELRETLRRRAREADNARHAADARRGLVDAITDRARDRDRDRGR